MYFSAAASFREGPRQHELRFKDRSARFYAAIERRRHPAESRMSDMLLNVNDHLGRIGLVPAPIELLGNGPKLHDEVAGQVLRPGLAALLPPKAEESALIAAHDDPGIRAADEVAAIGSFDPHVHATLPAASATAGTGCERRASPWRSPPDRFCFV
jgi:hypothetical protein